MTSKAAARHVLKSGSRLDPLSSVARIKRRSKLRLRLFTATNAFWQSTRQRGLISECATAAGA
jgi:hypothetical protein